MRKLSVFVFALLAWLAGAGVALADSPVAVKITARDKVQVVEVVGAGTGWGIHLESPTLGNSSATPVIAGYNTTLRGFVLSVPAQQTQLSYWVRRTPSGPWEWLNVCNTVLRSSENTVISRYDVSTTQKCLIRWTYKNHGVVSPVLSYSKTSKTLSVNMGVGMVTGCKPTLPNRNLTLEMNGMVVGWTRHFPIGLFTTDPNTGYLKATITNVPMDKALPSILLTARGTGEKRCFLDGSKWTVSGDVRKVQESAGWRFVLGDYMSPSVSYTQVSDVLGLRFNFGSQKFPGQDLTQTVKRACLYSARTGWSGCSFSSLPMYDLQGHLWLKFFNRSANYELPTNDLPSGGSYKLVIETESSDGTTTASWIDPSIFGATHTGVVVAGGYLNIGGYKQSQITYVPAAGNVGAQVVIDTGVDFIPFTWSPVPFSSVSEFRLYDGGVNGPFIPASQVQKTASSLKLTFPAGSGHYCVLFAVWTNTGQIVGTMSYGSPGQWKLAGGVTSGTGGTFCYGQ